MNFRGLAAASFAVAVVASSQAGTFATFDDPSTGTPPLFTIDTNADTLNGGWSGSGLLLRLPFIPQNFSDATFTTSTINFVPLGPGVATTGGGEVDFFDSSSNPIFSILFDSGILTLTGFGGNDFYASNVTFTGPDAPQNLTNQQFAFSFSNVAETDTGFSATAAFTSSADVVPEPASLALLGLGLAGLAARRRRTR